MNTVEQVQPSALSYEIIGDKAEYLGIMLERSTFLPGAAAPERVKEYGVADTFLGRLEEYIGGNERTETMDKLWELRLDDLITQYSLVLTTQVSSS